MTGTINLGDNYSIEEDSNGDLVITDNDGSPVLSHDSSDDTPFKLHDPLDVADLIDTALTDEIDTTQINADAVDTTQINADAVDTTQIATAAVVQAAIASGAVTVDELADALGTDSNNKIPGTTYFKNANAESLEATGMLYAKLSAFNAPTNITSGTFVNPYDKTDIDANGDITSSQQISPPTDGGYRIVSNISFTAGGTSDRVDIKLQNVTDSVAVRQVINTNNDLTDFTSINTVFEEKLQQNKLYEIQVASNDSTFSINNDDTATNASIKQGVVNQ